MAEVKWQARRTDDGVLVDVTGNTDGTPQTAPTPNPLEGGGGLSNPLAEPLAITSNSADVLLVTGAASGDFTDLAQFKASNGTVFYMTTDGSGEWSIREDGSNFVFERSSGPLSGAIVSISEYFFRVRDGTTIAYLFDVDRENGRIGFFGVTPVARAAANADTSGATLGQLETEVNELKALLRAYGLLT